MKKLLNYLVLIVLLVLFGYGCFYIFGEEKKIDGKILNVKEDYIVLENKQELKINSDTKYTLFNDEVDFNYFKDNFLRFIVQVTVKDDTALKINMVTEDNKTFVYAYFSDKATEDAKEQIKNTISIVNHVLSVKYISSDEAKEDMIEKSSMFEELFEKLDDNPLSSYLIIEVDGNINQIVRYLNSLDEVSEVRY